MTTRQDTRDRFRSSAAPPRAHALATLRAFGSQQRDVAPAVRSGDRLGQPSSTFQPWPYGGVFNEIAEEYERHRPAYPDALIDRACEVAGLDPGASVLEIGIGTGQLTRSLLARGLRMMAVEPGEQLIARARDQLADAGEVQFINSRLEEASLPATERPTEPSSRPSSRSTACPCSDRRSPPTDPTVQNASGSSPG